MSARREIFKLKPLVKWSGKQDFSKTLDKNMQTWIVRIITNAIVHISTTYL